MNTIHTTAVLTNPFEHVWPALPPATDRDMVIANHALNGTWVFMEEGTGDQLINIGRSNIDWAAGHIKHQEWSAQLHRFYCLPSLCAAWGKTGDIQYVQATRDYMLDWINSFTPTPDVYNDKHHNSLNLAIRQGSSQWLGWLGTAQKLGSDPQAATVFDDAFVQRIANSCATQLNYLTTHLTIVGNWRIAQADALICGSLRLADHPDAPTWRKLGVDILNEAVIRQILPDGAHVERTPDYHHWMTRVFFRYWQLAQAQPMLGLQIPTNTLARMMDYSIASNRPNGSPAGINDDRGPFSPVRADVRDMFKTFHQQAQPQDELHDRRSDPYPSTSMHFPNAAQTFLRSDWSSDATWLSFDASPWSGSHSHVSRNTLQLDHQGVPMLVDCGKLSYEASSPFLVHGKSTQSHNTANINGMNQAPVTDLRSHHQHNEHGDLVHCSYEGGYWSGEYGWRFTDGLTNGLWARHHRTTYWIRQRNAFVVVDAMQYILPPQRESAEVNVPNIEINWQLGLTDRWHSQQTDPSQELTQAHQGNSHQTFFEFDHPTKAGLLLCMPSLPAEAKVDVIAGQDSPLRGWVGSPAGIVPAPQLRMQCPAPHHGYFECVTVLLPVTGHHRPTPIITTHKPDPNVSTALTIQWGDDKASPIDQLIWSYRLSVPLAGEHGHAAMVHQQSGGRADNGAQDKVAQGKINNPPEFHTVFHHVP